MKTVLTIFIYLFIWVLCSAYLYLIDYLKFNGYDFWTSISLAPVSIFLIFKSMGIIVKYFEPTNIATGFAIILCAFILIVLHSMPYWKNQKMINSIPFILGIAIIPLGMWLINRLVESLRE